MNNNLKENLNNPIEENNNKQQKEEVLFDQQKPKAVNYDIYATANVFSKLFFHWVLYILKVSQ